jgi:hypothetical protein
VKFTFALIQGRIVAVCANQHTHTHLRTVAQTRECLIITYVPIRRVFLSLLFNSLRPTTTIHHLTTAAVNRRPRVPVRERHSMTSHHGRLRAYFRAATAGVCVGPASVRPSLGLCEFSCARSSLRPAFYRPVRPDCNIIILDIFDALRVLFLISRLLFFF